MRAEKVRVEADCCNPDRDEPSILPGRHAAVAITAATEQKFAGFLARGFDVVVERLTRLFRQLKSDWPSGLPLPHCGAIDGIPALRRPPLGLPRHRSPAACCRLPD